MIGAVGTQMQAAEARGAGKGAQAVGQQAKAAVAVAREAGFDGPRNAQGIAASAVARGIDPASLFAGQVAEPADVSGAEAAAQDDVALLAPDSPVGTGAAAEADATGNEIGKVSDFAPKAELVISEDPAVALLLNGGLDEEARA